MKFINRQVLFVTALNLLFAGIGQAQTKPSMAPNDVNEGTRGGGETVTVNGNKELRDLYEKTTCEWTSGAEMIDKAPHVVKVLDKIATLDWYFAFELERELRQLDWCITGKLIRVNTQDKDSLTVVENAQAEQVAIRLIEGNEVYVDSDSFASMTEKSKAYLLLHETMHSYLDVAETRRNDKLRSIIKTLSKVESGAVTDRNALRYALSSNKINFPASTDALDPHKDYILYVLATHQYRQSVLESAKDVTEFLSKSAHVKKFVQALLPTDAVRVTQFDPVADFASLCQQTGDMFIEKMFDGTKNLSDELAIAAVSAIQPQSTLKGKILGSEHFTSRIRNLIDLILASRASVVDARIMVPSLLKFLSSDPNGGSPTVEVLTLGTMYSVRDFESNAIASGVYVYIKNLVENSDWVKLDAVITGNSKFYQAFSLESVMGSVATIDAPISREKTYAIQNLIRVKKQFFAVFLQKIESDVSQANFIKFKSMLDTTKLGI